MPAAACNCLPGRSLGEGRSENEAETQKDRCLKTFRWLLGIFMAEYAVTRQLGRLRLRRRFLRKTRSELRAYPAGICKQRTTKSLSKKIKQTRLI
jgi:hypothetical protein